MNFIYIAFSTLFIATLSSCKRGKKISNPVPMTIVCSNVSSISPEGAFEPFNSFDPFEPVQYPQYVSYFTENEIDALFRKDLTDFLYKNNIFLVDTVCPFELRITQISVDEGINRESYTDSCSFNYETAYVYYRDLEVTVTAKLYRNGQQIESWTRTASSRERVRNKRGSCNEPLIGGAIRDVDDLISQAAKELRVKISKFLYELEG